MNHTELTNQGQTGPKGHQGQGSADGARQDLADDRRQSQAKDANYETPEMEKEAGLVEFVPPMEQKTSRVELVEVLERFGISVAGFDRLRSDAYEKQIAGRSLAELDQFYELLLGAGRSYKELTPLCPKWGAESKCPHWTTLQGIKERLTLEGSVRERLRAKGLIQARKAGKRGRARDKDEAAVYFAEAVEILAEELLAAKVEGKPISENLKLMDRLLRVAALRVRERREAREEAKLEWIQAGKPIQREPMIGTTGLHPSAKSDSETPVPLPEEYDPEAMDETDLMLEKVFGKNPYKDQGKVQMPEVQGQEAKIQNPESKLQGNSNNQAPMAEQTVKENGNKNDNRETREICETGEAKGEKETVLRELREGDKPPEAKVENGKIHQTGEQQVGLVELVPPVEAKTVAAEVKVDTRPEWAKRPANKLIGGRSAKHPKGIWRCDDTGLPVDVATGKPVKDVDWTTLIGFGGDGEKPLN